MAIENEEDDFVLRLEEKRHKKFVDLQQQFLESQKGISAALKNIVSAINKTSENKAVVDAIEAASREIGSFGKEVKDLKIDVATPSVNVNVDNNQLASKFESIEAKMNNIYYCLERTNELLEKMCQPKDYNFEFTRSQSGIMQSPIKAKQITLSNKK